MALNDPPSSSINIQGSSLGTALTNLLMSDDIQPGSIPSYEICKQIYLHHPLGAKMVEKPVKIAMSQRRKITVAEAPGDSAVKAFEDEWKKMGSDRSIFATRVQAKVYGISSLAMLIEGTKNETAIDPWKLWKQSISFNVYDPLNTAGSLVLNQNPLSTNFQHAQEIAVQGSTFHKSRARVVMNEFPIYISFTSSSFGFVGRSVYQRSLYPLKSFIQTMITDDMVSVKAGTIVAKIKSYGAAITNAIMAAVGFKRDVVKQARVGGVISIGTDGEEIESIDLKNLSEPFNTARTNIVVNIASGAPMPSKMLTDESFAQGFADGTEDAKEQARYIDGERENMQPLYDFLDMVCMYRAWNPEWYAGLQKEHPERFKKMDYEAAFHLFKDSAKFEWPSLLTEPESEQVRVADVKLKAMIAILEVLAPQLDRENLVKTVQWVADNMNTMKLMFESPLNLDYDKLEAHDPQEAALKLAQASGADGEPGEMGADRMKGPPGLKQAKTADDAIAAFMEAHDRLGEVIEQRKARVAARLTAVRKVA